MKLTPDLASAYGDIFEQAASRTPICKLSCDDIDNTPVAWTGALERLSAMLISRSDEQA
jgi:hypothetical protein